MRVNSNVKTSGFDDFIDRFFFFAGPYCLHIKKKRRFLMVDFEPASCPGSLDMVPPIIR